MYSFLADSLLITKVADAHNLKYFLNYRLFFRTVLSSWEKKQKLPSSHILPPISCHTHTVPPIINNLHCSNTFSVIDGLIYFKIYFIGVTLIYNII